MLGVILLINSDQKKCRRLLVDLSNSYLLGNNNYPKNFTDDFSLLLIFRKERGKISSSINKDSDREVSFVQ